MPLRGIKKKLALLRQSQAQALPLIYIIKDINSRYQFMTDLAAQHTGSSSADELIDRTVSDLQCDAAQYAAEWEHYDKMTLEQRSETLLLSNIQSAIGATVSLICNKPIINENGQAEGIETWVQVLPSSAGLDKIVKGYLPESSISLKIQSDGSKLLTLREHECVYYLSRGCTFLEIAEKLCISPRTVEAHITNIKIKLDVKTRSELIVKACELGYVQINLLDPNLQPGKLQLLGVKPFEPLE